MGRTPALKLTGRISIAFAVLFFVLAAPFMTALHAEPIDPLSGDDGESSQQQDQGTDEGESSEGSNDDTQKNYDPKENPFGENSEDGNSPSDGEDGARNNTTVDDKDNGREFIKGYNPLKEYDPTESKFASFLLWGVGKLTSALIWLTVAAFFFITALDFLYIIAPFMRPWLNDANEDGQGNSMPGMGGGSVGMGGFGNMGANQTAQKRSIANRQWVSDEAVECVKLLGGSSQAQMGGGGMMGSPMGGMGGYGAMGAAPEQDSNSRKSVLGTYIRKRTFTMILFGIAIVLLTGSTLMGFGMDIGTWLAKVVVYLGGKVSGADVPSLFE